jgi:hypothetical protein
MKDAFDGGAGVLELVEVEKSLKDKAGNIVDTFSIAKGALSRNPLEAYDAAVQIDRRLAEDERMGAFATVFFTALKTAAAHNSGDKDKYFEGARELTIYTACLFEGGLEGEASRCIVAAKATMDTTKWLLSRKLFGGPIGSALDRLTATGKGGNSTITSEDGFTPESNPRLRCAVTGECVGSGMPTTAAPLDQDYAIDRQRQAAAEARRNMVDEILADPVTGEMSNQWTGRLSTPHSVPPSRSSGHPKPLGELPKSIQPNKAPVQRKDPGIRVDPALMRTGGARPQKLVGTLFNNRVIPASAVPTMPTVSSPEIGMSGPHVSSPDIRVSTPHVSPPQTGISTPRVSPPQMPQQKSWDEQAEKLCLDAAHQGHEAFNRCLPGAKAELIMAEDADIRSLCFSMTGAERIDCVDLAYGFGETGSVNFGNQLVQSGGSSDGPRRIFNKEKNRIDQRADELWRTREKELEKKYGPGGCASSPEAWQVGGKSIHHCPCGYGLKDTPGGFGGKSCQPLVPGRYANNMTPGSGPPPASEEESKAGSSGASSSRSARGQPSGTGASGPIGIDVPVSAGARNSATVQTTPPPARRSQNAIPTGVRHNSQSTITGTQANSHPEPRTTTQSNSTVTGTRSQSGGISSASRGVRLDIEATSETKDLSNLKAEVLKLRQGPSSDEHSRAVEAFEKDLERVVATAVVVASAAMPNQLKEEDQRTCQLAALDELRSVFKGGTPEVPEKCRPLASAAGAALSRYARAHVRVLNPGVEELLSGIRSR